MADVMIIIIVFLFLGLALMGSIKHLKGAGSCCQRKHESFDHNEKKLSSSILGKKILKIEGMHCQNCAHHVMSAINSIEGVDLDKHLAIVSYDRELHDLDLYQAIEKAGYSVHSIENQ